MVAAALVLGLAACGSGRHASQSAQLVRGDGYTLSVPASWSISVQGGNVAARAGGALVSVTRFRLQRRYEPAMFAAAAPQLDRVAERLAAEAGVKLAARATTVVAGRRSRVYRYRDTKLGFVLAGRFEYQLLCRSPGGGDPDGACARLFSSFAVP